MIRDIVAISGTRRVLNTYYNGDRKSLRMQYDTQTTGHELVLASVTCYRAAIAYYRATGDPTLLNAGVRFVDKFSDSELRTGCKPEGNCVWTSRD